MLGLNGSIPHALSALLITRMTAFPCVATPRSYRTTGSLTPPLLIANINRFHRNFLPSPAIPGYSGQFLPRASPPSLEPLAGGKFLLLILCFSQILPSYTVHALYLSATALTALPLLPPTSLKWMTGFFCITAPQNHRLPIVAPAH